MARLRTRLWFGDERGYNATLHLMPSIARLLWFGDERGYNATGHPVPQERKGCGLVMKEDITQLLLRCLKIVDVVVW